MTASFTNRYFCRHLYPLVLPSGLYVTYSNHKIVATFFRRLSTSFLHTEYLILRPLSPKLVSAAIVLKVAVRTLLQRLQVVTAMRNSPVCVVPHGRAPSIATRPTLSRFKVLQSFTRQGGKPTVVVHTLYEVGV